MVGARMKSFPLQSGRFFLIVLVLLPFAFFWKNFVPDQLIVTSDLNIANITVQHENLVRYGWNACWSSTWWMGLPGSVPILQVENLLIWLLPPMVYAKFSMPFYLAIAGLSAYAFGRAVGFAPVVSLAVGIGWQLTGSAITDVPGGHHFRLFMLAIVPLMYLGLWRACGPRPVCGVLLAAASVAAMMGGLPDSGALLALGGVFFFVWMSARAIRTFRFWMQALLGTFVTLALCTQLFYAYVPYWTTSLKAADLSMKSSETPEQKWEWHTQWSFAPEEILEIAAPGFFGWQNMGADLPYWGRVGQTAGWEKHHQGFRNFRIDNPTTGTAVTALALVGIAACWRRRGGAPGTPQMVSMARCFCVLALISFVLSLGRHFPLYRWIYDLLPFMHGWRNPNKFFFTTSFCLVFLAGYGAQAILDALAGQGDGGILRRAPRILWGVAGALAAGAIVVFVLQSDLQLELAESYWTQQQTGAIVANMILSLVRAGLVWGLLGLIIHAAARFAQPHPERLSWLAAAWIVVAVAEMAFVAHHFLEAFNVRRALQPNPLVARVIDDGKRDLFRFKMIVAGDSVLNNLYFLQIPYHRIQSVDIPANSRPPDDYERYFNEMDNQPVLMWELANVRYLLCQTPVARQVMAVLGNGRLEWVADYAIDDYGDFFGGYTAREIPEDGEGSVYRLLRVTHPLPRALVVPEIRFAASVEELFALMKERKVDFKKTMLALPVVGIKPSDSAKPAKTFGAEVKQYSENRIVIETHSDQAAYLLLNDKYDPDWKVTVNGAPARMFRANFLMRGVEIPAGPATVVFTYGMARTPLLLTLAVWAALIVFGCLFCVFAGRRKVS